MPRWLVLLPIACATASPAVAQISTLKRFVGKDLRALSDKERAPLAQLLSGKDNHDSFFGRSPWYVWAIGKPKSARFVAFEGQPTRIWPGADAARIHLFDPSGKKLGQWHFSTGWRISMHSAAISYSEDFSAHIVSVVTTPHINGRDVAKQFFAISDNELYFVRMEDHNGQLLDNDYATPTFTIGIHPSAQTPEEWMGLLSSGDKAVVLSALTFLGGYHGDPTHPSTIELEDVDQLRMVKRLRNDGRVRALVHHHMKSDNTWIKDAARLAATTLPK
jgi:hypothetical protein